ncbi:hypothetical protein SDC9_93699 [bioreactor metagenome]|uniref:Uncharacterized protein n=1 Tax=bioreactor metagenome TaxID=1076179 RepID=A0A645A1S7_9ZZZZ
MGVDNVHYDCNSKPVGLINQLLKLFGSPEPRTHCVKPRNLVSERTIVRVFLYGHKLDSVVSEGCYVGQNVLLEMGKTCNGRLFGSHTYMSFIYDWIDDLW